MAKKKFSISEVEEDIYVQPISRQSEPPAEEQTTLQDKLTAAAEPPSKSHKMETAKPVTEVIEKKAGRKKGAECRKLCINTPVDYAELITIAAGTRFKGNISAYINSLIERDLQENGDIYRKIREMSK